MNQKSPSSEGPPPFQEVDKVLGSRTFEKTPTLRNLLSYLWENRKEELGEYRIATEALGRKPDFEPQVDAVVRVQISRLRERLKKFYESEGSQLPNRIVIPLGTHQVQFIEPPGKAEVDSTLHGGQRLWVVPVLCVIILLLALSNGWTPWVRQHFRQEEARNQQSPLPVFWQQFMGNGKRTSIIIPNPVFFLWRHRLVARDWRVNDLSRLSDSESLLTLQKQYGKPMVAQYYADYAEASAAWRLDRFLDPLGTQIDMKSTAEFPASALDWDNNLIVMGNPLTLTGPLRGFVDRLSFQLDVQQYDMKQLKVVDRRPAPGAPTMFESIRESPTRSLSPSIVAFLPEGARGTHILLVVTAFPPALVAYLLSEPGIKELEKAQAAHGHCRYFEAVILTETNGETELESKLVDFKPYNEK